MNENISTVAKVINKIPTKNKNIFLEIGDSTKKSLVFILNTNTRLLKKAKRVLVDDVIRVIGKAGRLDMIFAKDIEFEI